MEPPPLKLVIVQGPRKGETLGFRPGSTIRIGRVVRGNDVTIKDDGISSKHLVIGSESGKWTVQDLDSSNGTTLNSSTTTLPPFTPFGLRHGDTVKLGEFTSILVQFLPTLEDTAADSETGPSKPRRNPARRARVSKATEKQTETEGAKDTINSPGIADNKRRGRPPRRNVAPTETNNVRITRSRRIKDEDCVEVGIESKKARKKKNNLQELPLEENADLRLTLGREEEAAAWDIPVKEELELGENCEDGKVQEVEGRQGVREREERRVELDLERMTLEEWFDYMEVNLPKQIIEATEEIIDGMRRKAEQVREHVMERRKDKGVVSVG